MRLYRFTNGCIRPSVQSYANQCSCNLTTQCHVAEWEKSPQKSLILTGLYNSMRSHSQPENFAIIEINIIHQSFNSTFPNNSFLPHQFFFSQKNLASLILRSKCQPDAHLSCISASKISRKPTKLNKRVDVNKYQYESYYQAHFNQNNIFLTTSTCYRSCLASTYFSPSFAIQISLQWNNIGFDIRSSLHGYVCPFLSRSSWTNFSNRKFINSAFISWSGKSLIFV